jgi:RNA polymerase sigma factor (sigma-70 family)
MPISETTVRELMVMVEWHVRRRFGHFLEIEDLIAEGYVGLWQAVTVVEQSEVCKLSTAAIYGAVWQVKEYLRSNRNNQRRHSRRGQPIPTSVSLEEIQEYPHEEAPHSSRQTLPILDDFAGELIERLVREELVADLQQEMDAVEWEIIARTVLDDEKTIDVAADLEMSYSQVVKRRDAVLERLAHTKEEAIATTG